MSVSEFLAWDSGDTFRWQLVDGIPLAITPANRTHGALLAEIGSVIGNHLAASQTSCSVVALAGIIPRARSNHNFRIADLAVTCSDYQIEEWALTDPVLIVEILSPGDEVQTWDNIRTYRTIPSVRELLVLHSAKVHAEFLRRQPDGSWPEQPQQIKAGPIVLDSIGFSAELSALYRTTRFNAR
jgi:Uma2 family endonuclease